MAIPGALTVTGPSPAGRPDRSCAARQARHQAVPVRPAHRLHVRRTLTGATRPRASVPLGPLAQSHLRYTAHGGYHLAAHARHTRATSGRLQSLRQCNRRCASLQATVGCNPCRGATFHATVQYRAITLCTVASLKRVGCDPCNNATDDVAATTTGQSTLRRCSRSSRPICRATSSRASPRCYLVCVCVCVRVRVPTCA